MTLIQGLNLISFINLKKANFFPLVYFIKKKKLTKSDLRPHNLFRRIIQGLVCTVVFIPIHFNIFNIT